MKVYINGEFVDEKHASVSAFDTSFLYGEGLFETMRAYGGHIFALEDHLKRLTDSARVLEIKNAPDKEKLADACNKTLDANKLVDARIRLTLTRGPVGSNNPTVVITATQYDGYDKAFYEKGMSAIVLAGYRISSSPIASIKSTSYLPSVLARRRAKAAGCNEAILLNEQGNITEGSYTNVFAIREDKIYTPPVVDGLLPGVMRNLVIKTAGKAGYLVLQRSISMRELQGMDELFLTNTLMQVMPLTRLNGKSVGDGKPGPITKNLMELVSKEIMAATSGAGL